MKTITQKFSSAVLLIIAIFTINTVFAQVPQKISYQAIIRNASNTLVANTTVGMKISILEGSTTGLIAYAETQNVSTNDNGLVTLQIGNGTVLSGVFSNISWVTGVYFIKTEIDPTGGTNYTITGTSQLLSVPYALSSADNKWSPNLNGINNNAGYVGIGTTTPSSLLNVNGQVTIDQKNFGGYGGLLIKGGVPGNNYPNVAMSLINTNNADIVAAYVGGVPTATSVNSESMDLTFATSQTGVSGLSERMTIKSDGKVGIGTTAPSTKLEVNGYTKLGNSAPAIKMIQLTGTTSAIQGGITSISHGLVSTKIISATVLVEYNTGFYVPASYEPISGGNTFTFDFYIEPTSIVIWNRAANSASILSKPVKILITYEE